MKVLFVDDDPALGEILADYLRRFEHEVEVAGSGAECLEMLAVSQPDVVLLDVNMPGMDGWQTLRRLRDIAQMPVIMLTARSEESDILTGFGLGADDYVSKPFSFAQLEARIRAVASRHATNPEPPSNILIRGELRVDLDAHRVTRAGTQIKLTPTEFRLLVTLMEQPNKVLSPEVLVKRVWGEEYGAESDYVRRYIWYLRQKIETNPEEPEYIRNERNMGYYLATGDDPAT